MKSALVTVLVAATLSVADLEAFGFATGGLIAFVQLFLVPITGVMLVLLGLRRDRRRALPYGVGLLIAAVSSLLLSGIVNQAKLAASKQKGDEVCVALVRYQDMHGTWPDDLEQLVPGFLPEIPASSMGLVRKIPFSYDRSPDSDYRLGFASTFFIYCSRGPTGTWLCDD